MNSRVPSLRWIGPPQRDDDKLISEAANISGGKAASVYASYALRSRRADRSSLVYLGVDAVVCAVLSAIRVAATSAVPWRLASKAAIHDGPEGIASGLMESKNTSAESAIQFGG